MNSCDVSCNAFARYEYSLWGILNNGSKVAGGVVDVVDGDVVDGVDADGDVGDDDGDDDGDDTALVCSS